jgi:hypothetical protein
MTSDVKGWEQFFTSAASFFPCVSRKSRSQYNTTGDHAALRGLAPTFLASVGCLPHARDERTCRPPHAAEGDTKPGLHLCREKLDTSTYVNTSAPTLGFRWHGNLLGNGPHEADQFPSNGDDDLLGLFALSHQLMIPCAEPDLGLPADGLHRLGAFLEPSLHLTTDVGRIPVRPGPLDQDTTRMGMARLGHTALLTPRPTGRFRGCQPELMHELSGCSQRVRAPSAATVVTATVHGTPRRAWRASTTGAKRQVLPCSWSASSRRPRRSVCAVTVRTSSCQTICCAGVGHTTSLSQRRGPGSSGLVLESG